MTNPPPPPPESLPPEPDPVPVPEWKTVRRLPIQDQTIDVLKKAKAAAEQEVADLRKKLERLRYGT